ncbi:hypothetical protein HYV82_01870 [Candidatus Woesearchaeota archaeon]|nr:hypothetical protein [Candidatus Woesearchaeota archaeon]
MPQYPWENISDKQGLETVAVGASRAAHKIQTSLGSVKKRLEEEAAARTDRRPEKRQEKLQEATQKLQDALKLFTATEGLNSQRDVLDGCERAFGSGSIYHLKIFRDNEERDQVCDLARGIKSDILGISIEVKNAFNKLRQYDRYRHLTDNASQAYNSCDHALRKIRELSQKIGALIDLLRAEH